MTVDTKNIVTTVGYLIEIKSQLLKQYMAQNVENY